jgi:hypothetical protein
MAKAGPEPKAPRAQGPTPNRGKVWCDCDCEVFLGIEIILDLASNGSLVFLVYQPRNNLVYTSITHPSQNRSLTMTGTLNGNGVAAELAPGQ